MITPINPVLAKWNLLNGSGIGRWIFSRGVGLAAPYTNTIGARVQTLEPGLAVITMRDRRNVRNHLRSIHAAAMLNLTEMTGGLLSVASIPADARMIITRVELDFVKKGRGTLLSTGRCIPPESSERAHLEVDVVIRDSAGDEVARGWATTLVGPIS
jgi:acyl-coenzyme A thioesterase PaaI-like protein